MRGKGEGSITFDATRGLWVARIELPNHTGDPKNRRRKTFRAKDKNELIRRMNDVRTQLKRAGDLPTASMTVEQWVDYWMREIVIPTRRPSTLVAYRSNVKIITKVIGGVRLDKVTPVTIRRVITQMKADERSGTYQRNVHSVMSAIFRDAEREGRIGRNPVDLVQAPLRSIPELEVLTPDEATTLVSSFRESPDAFMWATFILTGARRGEILGLEWDRVTDHLDLSWQLQRIIWQHGCKEPCGYKHAAFCPKKRLEIPTDYEYRHIKGGLYWTRPKSRAGWRVIPLVEPLKSLIERWRELAPTNEYGLVFTDGGEPIDPSVATKAWPLVLKEAGITKHVRLHDLRHTTVDLLYGAGVPEDLITLIVGHSNRAMSRAYRSKGDNKRLTAAMKQLSGALGYSEE